MVFDYDGKKIETEPLAGVDSRGDNEMKSPIKVITIEVGRNRFMKQRPIVEIHRWTGEPSGSNPLFDSTFATRDYRLASPASFRRVLRAMDTFCQAGLR